MNLEIKRFFTACMFYTRIPVPKITGYSPDLLTSATRYFPFIGLIIGGVGAALFWGLHCIMPLPLAVILSVAATILATGAFHEDAFADFADGFGGGYTPDRILEIMKDSRLGTYGAVALVCMLSAKIVALIYVPIAVIPFILIAAHTYSRYVVIWLIYTAPYVQADLVSKSKPIGHKSSKTTFVIATLFGATAFCFLPMYLSAIIIGFSVVIFLVFRNYTLRKLKGYTGDVLGALQQISELAIYILAVVFYTNYGL